MSNCGQHMADRPHTSAQTNTPHGKGHHNAASADDTTVKN